MTLPQFCKEQVFIKSKPEGYCKKGHDEMNVIIHVRLMHTERMTTKARLKKCAM